MDPTDHNTNQSEQLTVPAPTLDVAWSDGRLDDKTRAEHARRTRQLHARNARYREAALRGLEEGRRRRHWDDEAILQTIRDFYARAGRRPGQRDFRAANGLAGAGTVWKRFGSHALAVQRAKAPLKEAPSRQERGHSDREGSARC